MKDTTQKAGLTSRKQNQSKRTEAALLKALSKTTLDSGGENKPRTRDGRTKKRANREGSIFPRKDRNGKVVSYRAVVTVGWKDGRQVRHSFSAPTKEAVREWMARMTVRKQDGMLPNASNLTLALYLEEWLKHKAAEVRPSTLRGYRQVIENHVNPLLGRERLDRIQPRHIDQLHKIMQAKKLSHRMVEYAHVLIHGALDYAVRLEMLPRNVANAVRLPRKQAKPEMRVWSVEEAQRFVAVLEAQNHPYYPLFYTALSTGMRRGELMALRWSEVDLEAAQLKVTATLIEQKGGKVFSEPKTRASRRIVALSPELVAVLKAQKRQLEKRKEQVGNDWKEHDLVFPSGVGTPIDSGNLAQAFKRAAKAARVPTIRIHDLRHTHASLLALKGISAKVIADRLGHTNMGFTLQVYTHLYDQQRREAAINIGSLNDLPQNKEGEPEER